MNKSYYKELKKILKSRTLSTWYFSPDNKTSTERFNDFFLYIGSHKVLSDLIVKLANENKISTDELVDLFYSYQIAKIKNRPMEGEKSAPLFVQKKLNKKHLLISKIEKDTEENILEFREKGEKVNEEYDFSFTKEDKSFIQKINGLLQEELTEMIYNSEEPNNPKQRSTKDYEIVVYKYNETNLLGTLVIGNIEIIFKKERAAVINYFYKIRNMDSGYKTYQEMKLVRISSIKLRQDIEKINKRVEKETDSLITQIIGTKEKNKNKEINAYRWEVKS